MSSAYSEYILSVHNVRVIVYVNATWNVQYSIEHRVFQNEYRGFKAV